jgi:cytochrome c peroxidase
VRPVGRGIGGWLALAVALLALARPTVADTAAWTPEELRILRSMWIGTLGPPPDDPSNAYDTDPRAAALGRRLFFDKRLSRNGKIACATCHQPALGFQDGKPVAEGLGRLTRRSMPLAGVGQNTWFFWDGRKDSLWSQALAPIENPLELGMTRAETAMQIVRHYRADYEAIFGPIPAGGGETDDENATKRVFVNVGKAIAAFVRTIRPEPARFDRYVAGVLDPDAGSATLLTPAEIAGLRLFIGKAKCRNCHAGPLLTNGEFHATRVPQSQPDAGRSAAVALVTADEFNCTGSYSDAKPEQCAALRFMDTDTRETQQAFKVPSLRNVAARPPYMHAGQFATLSEVVRFYRDRSRGSKEIGHGDLSDRELADLEAFLGTLTGGVSALAADDP